MQIALSSYTAHANAFVSILYFFSAFQIIIANQDMQMQRGHSESVFYETEESLYAFEQKSKKITSNQK